MKVKLEKLLKKYGYSEKCTIHEVEIFDCVISFMQLRDGLYLVGNILQEDRDEQIYVASVKTGFLNMNHVVVAMQLKDNVLFVMGFSKEGIIKQNLCEKAFSTIKNIAIGKSDLNMSKFKKNNVLLISLVVLVGVLIMLREVINPEEKQTFIKEVEETMIASQEYNEAVSRYNELVQEYNSLALQTSVDNIEGFPLELEKIATVSEDYDANVEVVKGENNKEKIKADTDTVLEMTESVEQAIFVLKQITVPTDEWVIERLNKVNDIKYAEAVTEDNDPNKMLGKEGGYEGCVYFTIDATRPDKIPGNTIVEKGTDAGGAIEIYSSKKDAEARIEYLSGFDDTVLYSGSYAIIGTMVIRTSYRLSDEQQLEFTNQITTALTMLE